MGWWEQGQEWHDDFAGVGSWNSDIAVRDLEGEEVGVPDGQGFCTDLTANGEESGWLEIVVDGHAVFEEAVFVDFVPQFGGEIEKNTLWL